MVGYLWHIINKETDLTSNIGLYNTEWLGYYTLISIINRKQFHIDLDMYYRKGFQHGWIFVAHYQPRPLLNVPVAQLNIKNIKDSDLAFKDKE